MTSAETRRPILDRGGGVGTVDDGACQVDTDSRTDEFELHPQNITATITATASAVATARISRAAELTSAARHRPNVTRYSSAAGLNPGAQPSSEHSVDTSVVATTALSSSADSSDGESQNRMFGNEVDYEELHEASARLVAENEVPCDSMVNVLALGFWQILEDKQLEAAETWLKFFRRLISGSEWRAQASPGWVRGFNTLLERCQHLVHARYGSFLQVAQVYAAEPSASASRRLPGDDAAAL